MESKRFLQRAGLAAAIALASVEAVPAQQLGVHIPRLNQKRDGAIKAYEKAIRERKVKSLLGVSSAEILRNPSAYNLIKIELETDCYRSFPLKSADDVRLHVRSETKRALETLCQNAVKFVTLPPGIQAVRVVASSLTRNVRLSKTEISAHTLGLGIDFSISRIDVKSGGLWTNNANMPELRTKLLDALKKEILKLRAEKRIVPTIEGAPPHLHISVMPDGYVPVPPTAEELKKPVKKVERAPSAITKESIPPVPKTVAPQKPMQKAEAPKSASESAEARSALAQEVKKFLLTLRPSVNPDNHRVEGSGYLLAIDRKDYIGALVLTYRQLNDPKNSLPKGGLAEVRQRIDFCRQNIK